MGKLIVNGDEYLINTSMNEQSQDYACEVILRDYASDATIDFVELW